MTELRDRVAALDGEQPVQLRLYLPAANEPDRPQMGPVIRR
jgi:hypothetical protein